jgi:hypothetical protein
VCPSTRQRWLAAPGLASRPGAHHRPTGGDTIIRPSTSLPLA